MSPAPWKKWMSYLFEVPIESRSSEHNDHLYLSLVRGRYQLCTENAIYSFGDLYSNFYQTFERLDLDKYPIQKVLILGFGLASIPYMLEKVFGRDYHYIGVDIDEEVLDMANTYVLPELHSSRQLICGDAFAFVQACVERFDLIVVDLFLDNVVPRQFESDDFVQGLSNLLNTDGLLLFNRLADTPTDQEQTKRFYEDTFLRFFPNGKYWEIEQNWMLVEGRVLVDE